MNDKQFKYVLTLANERSFSRAAELLNITQPSLSQYIKKIEKEMGMELFDRSGGEVRITDAGRAFIDIGRKMLDLEHQLESSLSDIASFKSGTITIGISAHRSVALMPPVVKAFKALYPGITLRVVEKSRRELIEAAEQGEFDLVLTTLPVNDELFASETVFIEENVIAVPSDVVLPSQTLPERKYPAISAASLNGLPFAMLNEDHLMQRKLQELIKTYALQLKKEVECTSLEALVGMAKEGIGAAYIPACLAKGEGLHFYSIRETVPKRVIVLIYRKEQYLSKAVRDLKDLMHEVLG